MTRSRIRRPAHVMYGCALGGQLGLWLAGPHLATLLAVCGTGLVAAAMTVVATALYAPEHISDRAFRLLNRATGRQCPPRRGW